MKIILYLFLGLSVCSLGANGKRTTKNPGICGKGIVTTFPIFVSNKPNLSTENGTCYQVNNKFNLLLQCLSGPKYVCVLITTTTKLTTTTPLLPTTTPTVITSATAGPADACIITSITASSAPTTSSNTTSITTTARATIITETTASATPTTLSNITATTPTETTATTTTKTPITTTTTTSTILPGCTYNGVQYSVGQIYINKSTLPLCKSQVCQSNHQMQIIVNPNTTGNCNDTSAFTQKAGFGCFNTQLTGVGDFCEARSYCQSIGGDLITSNFLNNNVSFYQLMNGVPGLSASWIGMYGRGTDLYWINGSIATNTFNLLKSTAIPLRPSYDGQCVFLKSGLRSTWSLDTADCTSPYPFIRCMREP